MANAKSNRLTSVIGLRLTLAMYWHIKYMDMVEYEFLYQFLYYNTYILAIYDPDNIII